MNMGGKSGNSPSLPAARGTPTGVNGILSESELSKSRTITQAQVARRRLDCPAFRRALETGQTKRRILQNLCGGALNGHFQNPPFTARMGANMRPRPLRSLRFQKCPFSAPGDSTQMKIPTWEPGALTGRLASTHSATGQTKRHSRTEPIRRRTQRTFEPMLTPLTVAPTPQPPRFVRTGFKRPLGATGNNF